MRGTKGTLCGASYACAVLAIIGGGLVHPATGRADPIAQLSQVMLNDEQPELIALRYVYGGGGLLISRDGGRSFALTCNDALGTELHPTAAFLAADGQLLLGTFAGLQRDDGRACGLTSEPRLSGRFVMDFAQHPRDPRVMFAASTAESSSLGALFRRDADGGYSSLGVADSWLVTRLRVAAREDGGLRFYESIVAPGPEVDPANGSAVSPQYFIRFSDDEGAHWTMHPVQTDGGSMRLEAVDPRDPERLLISIARDPLPDLLLRSDDAGATFELYLIMSELGGLAILPDGRVFIGDAGGPSVEPSRGLWRAMDLTHTPTLVTNDYAITCLGYRPSDGRLLACQPHAFGAVDLDDGAFTPWVHLHDVPQLLDCAGTDVRELCRETLVTRYCNLGYFPCAPLCDGYRLDLGALDCSSAGTEAPRERDAGKREESSDAGTAVVAIAPRAEPNPPAHTQPGRACTVQAVPGGSAVGPLSAWLLAAMLLLRRRQRRQWSGTGSSLPSGRR